MVVLLSDTTLPDLDFSEKTGYGEELHRKQTYQRRRLLSSRWHPLPLGVHSSRALLDGKSLKGLWFNLTREYVARNRGEDFDRLKYATEEELAFSPLPCWVHLSPEEYRKG